MVWDYGLWVYFNFFWKHGAVVAQKMKNDFLNEFVEDTYILKYFLKNGREHNIMYLKGPNMITLF